MTLLFATANVDKLKQVQLLLDDIKLKSPKDFNLEDIEVIEDGTTLKANAYKKAKTFYELTNVPTISDDTGLFVDALDNRPGVFSHRYAGDEASYKDNRVKLLSELEGINNRDAYFKTLVCFIDKNGKDHYFEGILEGQITKEEFGDYEFGYDQIFLANGFNKTLGQMTNDQINKISHRSKAINKFVEYFKENL